jgi:hypothetical protein
MLNTQYTFTLLTWSEPPALSHLLLNTQYPFTLYVKACCGSGCSASGKNKGACDSWQDDLLESLSSCLMTLGATMLAAGGINQLSPKLSQGCTLACWSGAPGLIHGGLTLARSVPPCLTRCHERAGNDKPDQGSRMRNLLHPAGWMPGHC